MFGEPESIASGDTCKRAEESPSNASAAADAPPDQPGWRIEVAALDAPGAPPPQVIYLKNYSIATSGDMFQRVEIGGVRYSHIVNPHTGIGLTDHSLVTVIAFTRTFGRYSNANTVVSALSAALAPA